MGWRKLEIKTLLEKLMEKEKYRKVVIFVGLAGIVLIFISGFLKSKPKTDLMSLGCRQSQEYTKQMQVQLQEIVSGIEGVGKASVLVTLESGLETVYAKEEKKSKESLEDNDNGEGGKKKESDGTEVKYIKVKDSDGTEKALALKEMQPVIKGVVVVCQGGNDKKIKKKVAEAVKTALNISEKRVYVTR